MRRAAVGRSRATISSISVLDSGRGMTWKRSFGTAEGA